MVVIGCVSVAVFRTLFVRLIAFLLAAAVAAAAAAPTALAACAAFALLGHGGGRGCLVGAFVLRCDEVFEIVKSSGGIEKLSLAFYQDGDMLDDKVWDIWRVEGPSLVWHFRGKPHVHAYINIGVKS